MFSSRQARVHYMSTYTSVTISCYWEVFQFYYWSKSGVVCYQEKECLLL